ncbi:hypothetical protein ACJ72_08673 [Emergomyces africanus]|uniref:Uncharacterized protein n=1 Tax=Emergomyces africanus TaxID=1955775 RepID=A0A1B7NJP3_9EURO|nr:hypothetical protein ACJ72_08673 [Emergomyces africanus]
MTALVFGNFLALLSQSLSDSQGVYIDEYNRKNIITEQIALLKFASTPAHTISNKEDVLRNLTEVPGVPQLQ